MPLAGFFAVAGAVKLPSTASGFDALVPGMVVHGICRGSDLSMIGSLAAPIAVVLKLADKDFGIAVTPAGSFSPAISTCVQRGALVRYSVILTLCATLAIAIVRAGLGRPRSFDCGTFPSPNRFDLNVWLGRSSIAGVLKAFTICLRIILPIRAASKGSCKPTLTKAWKARWIQPK